MGDRFDLSARLSLFGRLRSTSSGGLRTARAHLRFWKVLERRDEFPLFSPVLGKRQPWVEKQEFRSAS